MSDAKDTLDQINTAFAELKSKNDSLEAQVKATGAADSITKNEIAEINKTISELEKKMARPVISTDKIESADDAQYRSAFNAWSRKGEDGEFRAISTAVAAEGGYALPKLVESGLYTQLRTLSPIRALASVRTVSTNDYRIQINNGGTAAGWVGEKAARPETAASTLAEVAVNMGELYANPTTTQRALDDLSFDVDAFLQDEIAYAFAVAESAAFVSGDGTDKPKGFLTETLSTVKTGAAAAMSTSADPFLIAVQTMPQAYRTGAAWLMNSLTLANVRTLKNAEGNYIWQPSLIAGTPATVAGYAVYECEDMPAVAANAIPAVFANLNRGYVIADRTGISLLRDPYSNKPFVSFYTTKRVGGRVRDTKAFVAIKCAV